MCCPLSLSLNTHVYMCCTLSLCLSRSLSATRQPPCELQNQQQQQQNQQQQQQQQTRPPTATRQTNLNLNVVYLFWRTATRRTAGRPAGRLLFDRNKNNFFIFYFCKRVYKWTDRQTDRQTDTQRQSSAAIISLRGERRFRCPRSLLRRSRRLCRKSRRCCSRHSGCCKRGRRPRPAGERDTR